MIVQRDMDYFGGGGGEYSQPKTSELKSEKPQKTSKVKFVTPSESSNCKNSFKMIELDVLPHGSYNVDKVNRSNVNVLKTLYALSKDANEYYHLSNLFEQVFKSVPTKGGIPNPNKYNLESFCTLILGIREINSISPTTINILEVKSTLQLEDVFLKNKKYLHFSKHDFWKSFLQIGTIDHGKVKITTQHQNNSFVSDNFTNDEIKKLVKKNIDLQGSNLERVSNIVLTTQYDLDFIISRMNVYFKNVALLKEYNIDFDKLNLKKREDVLKFFTEIGNTPSYKILNKLFQRLNSHHRQLINSNAIIYDSFFQYAAKIHTQSIDFKQIEPVLSRIHTYQDVNVLLNALYGIISEFNIYSITNRSKKLKGAKVVYFNESDQVAIIRISKFAALNALGSPSWCVQHIEDKFDSYTSGFRRFYIFVDAKAKYRSMSKIGFTIYPNGSVMEACDFENRSIQTTLDFDFYSKYGKHLKGFFGKSARRSN